MGSGRRTGATSFRLRQVFAAPILEESHGSADASPGDPMRDLQGEGRPMRRAVAFLGGAVVLVVCAVSVQGCGGGGGAVTHDGTNVRRALVGPLAGQVPICQTPTTEKIAFRSDRSRDEQWHIYLIEPDDSGLTRSIHIDGSPSWWGPRSRSRLTGARRLGPTVPPTRAAPWRRRSPCPDGRACGAASAPGAAVVCRLRHRGGPQTVELGPSEAERAGGPFHKRIYAVG